MIALIIVFIIAFFNGYYMNRIKKEGYKYMNILELLEFNFKLFLINLSGLTDINRFGSILLENLTNDTILVKLNRRLQKKYGEIVSTYILTKSHYHYILDAKLAKQILNDSPQLFGPGRLKNKFFSEFMPLNLGISRCNDVNKCPWKKRREFNEDALGSNFMTPFYLCIDSLVDKSISEPLLKIDDFKIFSYRLAADSIYGIKEGDEYANLLKTFMNSIGDHLLTSKFYKNYKDNLQQEYKIAPECSLLNYANIYRNECPNAIDDQIPHWFAPFIFMFSFLIPNLLCVILNFKDIHSKILTELDDFDLLSKETYLHYCVIEHIRLFNTININLHREVEKDMDYHGYSFKQGDQLFMGFANILRDETLFKNPDEYNPDRWLNKPIEEQNIVFGIGPQQCPSRNISPVYYKAIIYNLLKKYDYKVIQPKLKNRELYFINPYNIKFMT